MENRRFNAVWETEYICSRVKRISDAVRDSNFDAAMDYIKMILFLLHNYKLLQ